MVNLITSNHPEITEAQVRQRTTLCFLLLDPSWFRQDIGSETLPLPIIGSVPPLPNILSEMEANTLEHFGRKFCFQVYTRRNQLIFNEGSDSETEDEDSYSLHDTSDDTSSIDTSFTEED